MDDMGGAHGETWPDAAAFLRMWVAMSAAMMLPAAAPVLWRAHHAVGAGARGIARGIGRAALAAAAYLLAWATLGVAVYPLGALLRSVATAAPALPHAPPSAVGAVVLAAGAYQRSGWKARHLAACRATSECRQAPRGARAAWRDGVRLARHCVPACAHLMAISLVVDAMDVRLMAAVGAVIAVERLAPAGDRVARATGVGLVVAGALLMVRAAVIG